MIPVVLLTILLTVVGGTAPKGNSVVANDFGRNRPDIFWDGSGSGNSFAKNKCDKSVPTRLCR
jgi:hypothetical protein